MLKVVDLPEIGEKVSVDGLGRVTIPKALRKKYDIEKDENVEVIPTKEGLLIRNAKVIKDKNREYGVIQCEIENVVRKYINSIDIRG